jgi:hypothetical protein
MTPTVKMNRSAILSHKNVMTFAQSLEFVVKERFVKQSIQKLNVIVLPAIEEIHMSNVRYVIPVLIMVTVPEI